MLLGNLQPRKERREKKRERARGGGGEDIRGEGGLNELSE